MQRRAILAGLGATAACVAAGPSVRAASGVLVFAAASLTTALTAIAAAWQRESGKRVRVSYAASSALAKQIDEGAPAGLYISADERWMDYLQKRRRIVPASRVDLLGNSLVLVAPRDSTVTARIAPGFPLARLLGDGRLAMAEPDAVPAGIYGKAALKSLGVWSSVAGRIAAAQNVRAALLLVARGEAPLGIVYKTDARAEPAVRIVDTFPAASHPPIVYPMALTVGAPPEAAAFAAYLRGPAAAKLFAAQGFTVLDRKR